MKISNMLSSQDAFNLINQSIDVEDLKEQILELDEWQSAALVNSILGKDYNVYVISGHPGSGKTALLKLVLKILSRTELSILAVAPYGTAANNMGGKTLGSVFNGIDHYLPATKNGYIHYKKGEHNRKWIQESTLKRLQKYILSTATEIKVLLDEFSSFTSEELSAFHQALNLVAKGRKVSYIAFGQPLQIMSFGVGKDDELVNKASAPWCDARFMKQEDNIVKFGSLLMTGPFDNHKPWVVKSIVLEGMHRCSQDEAFANCLINLGKGSKVNNSPEWEPIINTFTTVEPREAKHTYIVPKRLEKEYNKKALLGKTPVYFNSYIEINGVKGFITKIDYASNRLLINKKWVNVSNTVINYLKTTELHPIQKLGLGVPYMSWVNNESLEITNGTRGLITNLKANEWIEVDGKQWTYVKALDVPTDAKGDALFIYKALPGHMAAAMSSRKVLGATITCTDNSKVVYHLPKYQESGAVYVCMSRVQKASDLIIYFEGNPSLNEMIEQFNNAFVIDEKAFKYWDSLVNTVSYIEVDAELPNNTSNINPTIQPTTVSPIKTNMIDYKKLNEMTLEEYSSCKVIQTLQTTPYTVEIVSYEGDTFALAKVSTITEITTLEVKGEFVVDYLLVPSQEINEINEGDEGDEADEADEADEVLFYISSDIIKTIKNEVKLVKTTKTVLDGKLVEEKSTKDYSVFMKSSSDVSILIFNTKQFVEDYCFNENLANAIDNSIVNLYVHTITPNTSTSSKSTTKPSTELEELKAQLTEAQKEAESWKSKWAVEKARADKLEQTVITLNETTVSRSETIETLKTEITILKEELTTPITPSNETVNIVDQLISDPNSLTKLKVALGLETNNNEVEVKPKATSCVKVISGGQTGADEAGLAAAKFRGLETGGLMPKGFKTEKGSNKKVAEAYGLTEDTSTNYVSRTHKNAALADITLWFGNTSSPGYKCTAIGCKNAGKELVVCNNLSCVEIAKKLKNCKVINIAGNRESTNPGIYDKTFSVLKTVFWLINDNI